MTSTIEDLEEIYNELHFFDESTRFDIEKQASDIQEKIRSVINKIKHN